MDNRGSKSIILLVLISLLIFVLSFILSILPISELHFFMHGLRPCMKKRCYFFSNSSSLLALFPSRSKATNYSTVADPDSYAKQKQPVKIYRNADLDKVQILKENSGKCGVYRWTNLTNGNRYIGSSVNLEKRLKGYFSIYFLESELKKGRSTIYSAILKHGYSNLN